ncbi:hypothetical protein SAMN06296386_104242 [Lachnospiraceae bacterium]|nr:hypothetical protein SAMN06296386_104242 [Lachnospiraceae bacterium]
MANDFFPIERNRYFYGKLLTVRDFEAEQNYSRNKHRLINLAMNGSGIVFGLGVSASDDSTLLIESGLALDYSGREIIVEEALIRKLDMIEGSKGLKDSDDAWLCISYAEKETKPVNAVNTGNQENSQFNMTKETYKLFLTAETPDYAEILKSEGYKNVHTIYNEKHLTILFAVDDLAVAGDEISAHFLIIKDYNTPPIHFTLAGESEFTEDGKIVLEYSQDSSEKRQCLMSDFPIAVRGVTTLSDNLFSGNVELNLEIGMRHYKNYIEIPALLMVVNTVNELEEVRRKRDNLAEHIREKEIPIYLSKIELIHSTGNVFINTLTDLPFGQKIRKEAVKAGASGQQMEVKTSVRQLDYWQKPDVRASYNPGTGKLNFDFGIPSPEQYDYAISHGVVDLEMPGGIKVNSRFFSDEIPHGLGPGAVDVRLSVEFDDNGNKALLIGNKEVFKSKNSTVDPPWVETGVIVYPERGTMKIGVWLHDTVDGNRLKVHYFAQKPERDTDRIINRSKPEIKLMPEVTRISAGDRLHFRAIVEGTDDKTVEFSVVDENGGVIDQNGVYKAPEKPGTYEILAQSTADPEVKASAYVIIE